MNLSDCSYSYSGYFHLVTAPTQIKSHQAHLETIFTNEACAVTFIFDC